jgi:DNA replication protein DnaC
MTLDDPDDSRDEDRDKAQREAYAQWVAERQAIALRRWREQIPAAQQAAGDLDARVSAWVDRFLAGNAANLVLLGPVGTGKTWHAWHAVERAMNDGWFGTALFYGAYAWKRVTGPPLDSSEISKAAAADVLVLDDPGAHRLGEWDLEHLLGVVDERWNHRRPTIFTSNAPKLSDLFGERIASRLADGATAVVLAGDDRRRSR